jgi:SAM-dependent methyltransferase
MPDPAHALALLAEDGWRTLVDAGMAFEDAGGDALRAATAFAKRRADVPAPRRAAALELVSEGARLARKLGVDSKLVAVREAVEQATSGRVATWHAQQLPEGARVLEIGCGCGGDSLALAYRAKNLIACDVDPVRAACAHINLTTTGLATSRAVPGDGLELLEGEAADADVVFADPDRRAGGHRSLDPEQWSPPLSRLAALARAGRRVLVKAAPSLDADAVVGAFRVAYVSHAGECVEAFLESPCDGDAVRAVLLPDDGPSVTLSGDRGDAPSGRIGDALYVPDPAAIRARLLAELCREHGLRLVAPGIAFLTGERGAASPWLAAYEVLNVANGSQHASARCVRERGASDVRVHARGTRVPVEEIERIHRAHVDPKGGGPVLDLFVSRSSGGAVTIVARREDHR